MPIYESDTLTREQLEKKRKSQICAECGGRLNMFLDNNPNSPNFGKTFIACNDWHRTHHNGVARENREPKELNIPTWREKMEKEHGKEKATAMGRYHPASGQLNQSQAMHILKLVYPDAPDDEIIRCALLCRDFGLHPLKKEVYLIPFTNKKTGKKEWSTVVGIAADRKMAATQKGAYSFLDDTPRAASREEVIKQFGEDSEEAEKNFISICKVQGESGNQSVGFGLWPRGNDPYGIEKGNTKRNMSNIRAERQAVSRLPGRPLPKVEVVDEGYADLPEADSPDYEVATREIDTSTGEIIEQPKLEPSAQPPKSQTSPPAEESNSKPLAEPETQGETGYGKIPKPDRDPATVRSLTDLMKACHADFGMQPSQVVKELGYSSQSDISDVPSDCYIRIIASRCDE